MDIVSALQEKIKQAGLKDAEQNDLQENLLLQDQKLKEDSGYVKSKSTQSVFFVNNTYDNDEDEYRYKFGHDEQGYLIDQNNHFVNNDGQ